MEQARLDWSTAEVKNGVLSVGLDGERPKGWNKTFAATAAMLGGGTWGKVSLGKGRIKVAGVTPGVEDKLHHFLESAVLQANTDHAPETEHDSDEGGEQEQESSQGDSDDDPDSELTSRFKAFAD